MNTRRWEWRLAAFAIIVWLIFVTNPELRLLLILVDSMGLELIFILLAIQLRGLLPMIRVTLMPAGLWCCSIAFCILRGTLRALGALLPGRAWSETSALLYVLSKNLWCPISRNSAQSPRYI
jgi:hypothetical protein